MKTIKSLLLYIIPFLTLFSLTSCEKELEEEYKGDQMQDLYLESATLQEVGADSCQNYITKFCKTVGRNAELKQSKYFNPTLNNVEMARDYYELDITIDVNGGWADPVVVDFKF